MSIQLNPKLVISSSMVHSLTSPAAAATPFLANTSRRRTTKNILTSPAAASCQFQKVSGSNHDELRAENHPIIGSANVCRRNVALVLMGAFMGLGVGNGSAMAGARRPPPPPPTEKKDPNVSGTLAKILANKKRKEEMKEAIAKLREKGKPIN